jgi:hypothetical protein
MTRLVAPTALTDDSRRLLVFCRLDLATNIVAACLVMGMRIWLISNDWLDVVIGFALAIAAALVWAMSFISRGRTIAGLTILTLANWVGILAFTAMVPFTLNFAPLFVLIPALLAIRHLSRAGIRVGFAGAALVIAAAAALGWLQPGVGLEPLAPKWSLDSQDLLALPARQD